ncbi:YraN family protein [Persephonella sp.]
MKSYEKGRLFEDRAVDFLKSSGYEIIGRNFKTRYGEIDIIARDGDTVVFVEVRYRKSSAFGSPEETINLRKIKKIIRAANRYISMKGLENTDIRFDVIAMDEDGIRHIKNAFEGID